MATTLRQTWRRCARTAPPFRRTCDYTDCPRRFGTWLWRTRSGIHMEGRWFCTPQCLEHAIARVFDIARFGEPHSSPRHHRMPLGLLMLARGTVRENQLRAALSAQCDAHEGKIGQWLQRLGFATENQVVRGLALQWACPVLTLPAEAATLGLVPLPMLTTLRIMPVRFIPSLRRLDVASCTQIDRGALQGIAHMLECQTQPCVVSDTMMDRLLQRAEVERRSAHVFERIANPVEMARISVSYVTRLDSKEVRIARCNSFTWVRLESRQATEDLLFAPATEQNRSEAFR